MLFRDLTQADIPQLIRWLREFNSSFDYPGKAPIDDEIAAQFFSRFVGHEGLAAIVAESDRGEPIAVLGFSMVPHPWNGASIFYKAFWYSAKPRAGLALFRYVRDLCKNGNVQQIIIGSMTPRVNRLLEREGFKPIETNYILEL